MERTTTGYATGGLAVCLIFLSTAILAIANNKLECMNGRIGYDCIIYAELQISNCKAEGFINGIPFRMIDSSEKPRVSMPVNQYLVDGINDIELIINPGPTPTASREGENVMNAEGISAEFRLVKYPVGVFVGDEESGEELCRVSWSGEEGKEEIFPMSLRIGKGLGPVFGPCLWQGADVLKMNDKTVQQVTEFVKMVYDAYSEGNPDVINELAANRLDEGYRAYPQRDRSTMGQRFAVNLKKRAAQEWWSMLPFETDQFDLRLCAGDRMVECIREDWQPIVAAKLEGSDVVFSYPMFLSRVNGEWIIVR